MFLFTPRVRTEGGTAKLASSASSGIAPKLPAGKWLVGANGPGGRQRGLGLGRGPQRGSGWAWHKAGPGGSEGHDLPTGAGQGGPQSQLRKLPEGGAGARVSHAHLLRVKGRWTRTPGPAHALRGSLWRRPRPLSESQSNSGTAGGRPGAWGWPGGLSSSLARLQLLRSPHTGAGWGTPGNLASHGSPDGH